MTALARTAVWLLAAGLLPAGTESQGPSQPRRIPAAAAPRALVEELSTLVERGQLPAARTGVQQALERYPSDAELHNIAGVIDARERAYREAERHFRAAIEYDARLADAYLNLGRLYQEHAKDDSEGPRKALNAYRALLRIDPSNTEALYQAAYLNACAGDWSASRALIDRLPVNARSLPQARVVLAIDLAGLGQAARASETAAAVLSHPDLVEEDVIAALPAIDRLADATLAEQLFLGLDARKLASSAISLRRVGLIEMRRGHLDRARETLERALRAQGPPTATGLLDLARVAYKQKDFQGALAYLAHARDLDAGNPEIHFFFGVACIELNLGAEAYESLKKAVALAPDNAYVNYALGAVAIHRHEPSEALPYFEAYVRLKPEDPRGRFALGAARFYSSDFDGARSDLERAAGARETAAGAHYFLGRIARQLNELEKAREEIARALQADPAYADALAELGLLQTRAGDYEAAERSLMKALAIDADNYAATVNLTALYTRTRDPRREAQAARLEALQQKRAVAAQEFLRLIQVVQ